MTTREIVHRVNKVKEFEDEVDIEYSDDSTEWVDMKLLSFPYNLI